MSKRWSKEEEALLLSEYNKCQNLESLKAKFPGRTISSLTTKLYKLGVNRDRAWSSQDIELLIDLRAKKHSSSYIASEIGRTQGAVEKKIQELIRIQVIDRIRAQSAQSPGNKMK